MVHKWLKENLCTNLIVTIVVHNEPIKALCTKHQQKEVKYEIK